LKLLSNGRAAAGAVVQTTTSSARYLGKAAARIVLKEHKSIHADEEKPAIEAKATEVTGQVM
jgi:hypothetical protein